MQRVRAESTAEGKATEQAKLTKDLVQAGWGPFHTLV